jgi:arylsulfatase A-like enzyme/Tfp pilus assembly protein PilF
MRSRRLRAGLVLLLGALACRRADQTASAAPAARPSILLVTLDTTRADSIGPENPAVETPAFSGLAARGLRFAQAYATAPQTLPAHASMFTGLYPAGHGVHENGRRLGAAHEILAQRLAGAGYDTAAFISGFPLDRQFGLDRGFAIYDDELGGGLAERDAAATTARALDWLAKRRDERPFFLWVHYYDPHEPYAPPEPYRARYADDPYLGEIAAMDAALGALVAGFEARVPAAARRIAVVGDHGESRGEHGESFHGNLLYQGAMRVPLVLAGAGIAPGVRAEPVSARRLADTVLAWAGLDPGRREETLAARNVNDTVAGWAGLRAPSSLETVLDEPAIGEAMQPYLEYGWQPQVMVVGGRLKAIRAGRVEVYDVVADPLESRDLAAEARLDPSLREALRDYPLPAATAEEASPLDEEARRRLAGLGYLAGSGAPPRLRADAPRPADMTGLFAALDRGSALFVAERWAEAIAVDEPLLREDPHNPALALRLAAAHSALGQDGRAREYFARAERLAPDSLDLALYRGLHELRSGHAETAAPLLERVVGRQPERLPALAGLAEVRERQGRLPEAITLLERAAALDKNRPPILRRIGELAMRVGDTPTALRAYEALRDLEGAAFDHYLELGVLYLDRRRFDEAAEALDRVPSGDPRSPMALFKRAQVSALLGEADRAERVRAAYRVADPRLRALIEAEVLFRGIRLR